MNSPVTEDTKGIEDKRVLDFIIEDNILGPPLHTAHQLTHVWGVISIPVGMQESCKDLCFVENFFDGQDFVRVPTKGNTVWRIVTGDCDIDRVVWVTILKCSSPIPTASMNHVSCSLPWLFPEGMRL